MTRNRKQSAIQNAASSLCLLALLLAGCGSEPPQPPRQPPAVRVAVAVEAPRGRELRLSGTIEAERSVSLGFSVPGTVEEVLVGEGDRVERGQPLARLDPRSFRDAVGIARAKADQAEDAWRRLEPMHRNGTLPEVRWVEIETGRTQARLALSMAEKSLRDTVLRAPEAGVIAHRKVEPGATVLPGVPAFVLVQTGTVLATAPVPEREIAGVAIGGAARVEVAALNRSFDGEVRQIGVAANPLTRTYPVKVAVANPDGALRVGMVAEVHLEKPEARRPIVVPPEAVRIDEAKVTYVYVLGADGTLQRRRVEVDGYFGESIALTSGIAAGERVVISGTPMLGDGMRVVAVEG